MGTCPPAAGTASRLVGISKSSAARSRHDMTDRNVPDTSRIAPASLVARTTRYRSSTGGLAPDARLLHWTDIDEADAARDG